VRYFISIASKERKRKGFINLFVVQQLILAPYPSHPLPTDQDDPTPRNVPTNSTARIRLLLASCTPILFLARTRCGHSLSFF
jgi:hypothetical protein